MKVQLRITLTFLELTQSKILCKSNNTSGSVTITIGYVASFVFKLARLKTFSEPMAGLPEQSFDGERTVVVSNCPSDVGEDELTIHFQKKNNGGGDVDKIVLHGNVAFVIFDIPEGSEFFTVSKLI